MQQFAYTGRIESFGVGLRDFNPQKHATLVFSDDAGDLKTLHLASYNDLRCDSGLGGFYPVLAHGFDEDELDYFAERASRLWDKNARGIPYGFKYDQFDYFGPLGEFQYKVGRGLTCATFVLAFFRSVGHEVVDESSWRPDSSDTSWQETIYLSLASNYVTSMEEIVALKAGIGSPRFRPEDVIASVSRFTGEPVCSRHAKIYGDELLLEMSSNSC